MKIIKYLVVFVALGLMLESCSKEPKEITDPFVVSFKEKGINFNKVDSNHKVQLTFSEKPKKNGSVEITLNETNMKYGVDYKTIPEAKEGKIVVPFNKQAQKLEFTYVNIIKPTSSRRKLGLSISKINYDNSLIQGFSEFLMSFENSTGGVFLPNVGGPNEPNQVFIDLSSKTQKSVKRDTWALGFYLGSEFNVVINETNFAAAGAVDATDIDKVKEEDFTNLKKEVTVFTYKEEHGKYSDDPERDFSKNAIKQISSKPEENKVYLLNLGHKTPTKAPKIGSVATAGDKIGWRKIRILRKDNGYVLQYANLEDTTHKEVFISKSNANGYAFTYFDFQTEKIVKVAPRKLDWDMSFTVFTNKFDNGVSYGYSDFVLSNKLGNVKWYGFVNLEGEAAKGYKKYADKGLLELNTKLTYDNLTKDKLSTYESKLKNIRTIPGSVWRSVFKKTVTPIFFIIQDTDGNYYKLRFLQLVNEKKERGYPKFEYTLIK